MMAAALSLNRTEVLSYDQEENSFSGNNDRNLYQLSNIQNNSKNSLEITQRIEANLTRSISGLQAKAYFFTLDLTVKYLDKNSISGMLFGKDNLSAPYPSQIQMKMVNLSRLDLSKDLKSIFYNATLVSNNDDITYDNNTNGSEIHPLFYGTISGKLSFDSPITFDKHQSTMHASPANSTISIQLGFVPLENLNYTNSMKHFILNKLVITKPTYPNFDGGCAPRNDGQVQSQSASSTCSCCKRE